MPVARKVWQPIRVSIPASAARRRTIRQVYFAVILCGESAFFPTAVRKTGRLLPPKARPRRGRRRGTPPACGGRACGGSGPAFRRTADKSNTCHIFQQVSSGAGPNRTSSTELPALLSVFIYYSDNDYPIAVRSLFHPVVGFSPFELNGRYAECIIRPRLPASVRLGPGLACTVPTRGNAGAYLSLKFQLPLNRAAPDVVRARRAFAEPPREIGDRIGHSIAYTNDPGDDRKPRQHSSVKGNPERVLFGRFLSEIAPVTAEIVASFLS
jgi:hypothetical protein